MSDDTELTAEVERIFKDAAITALMMSHDDKSRQSSSQVDPKEDPDERLKKKLLRIAELDFECPEHRAQVRGFAIAERLSLELPRLADLARVPPQGHFSVLDVVLDAWDNDDLRKAALELPSTKAEALSRVVTALRAAKRALADLDESDRDRVAPEDGIDRLFEWVLGDKPPHPQGANKAPRPRQVNSGRPAGTIANPEFQIFVRDLLRAAERCGGRLTFDKHNGKGTLTEAIDILTPCLPADFVPRALPLTTIQRIKSRATKRR